jgi:MFS transporter, SP family, sugar:H+ symporter
MTYTVASSVTVVTQFVVSFCIPYLLYAPYANLGTKIGFVFAPLALMTLIFAIFAIPECRGLSVEEIDQLFLQKTPIRHFGRHVHGNVLETESAVREISKDGEGPVVELREQR